MAVTRQRSGDGSLGGDHRATSFRGAVEVDAKALPPKFPESMDLDFWEVRIFLEEDRFGGVKDGNEMVEVVEVSFRHFEFQMLYIRGQKLELSSPIRQVSMGLRRRQLASVIQYHKASPSLTYAVDAGKESTSTINRDQQWEAEVKRKESGEKK